MIKILLSGAPCSGKTTLFYSIPRHKLIIFVPEVARDILTKQPELKHQSDFQEYLLREQLRLEQLAEKSQNSLVICDRGYFDVIAYSKFFGYQISNELISQFSPYNMIFLTSIEGIRPVGEYASRSGFRERQQLDEIFHSVFKEIDIPVIELKGSPKTRLDIFLKTIESRFNIEGGHLSFEEKIIRRSKEFLGK